MLGTLTFFLHSLTHELFAGWLRKRPTWRQGSHTAEARSQPLLLHPCTPVNESHCQPCYTPLCGQGAKRGASKGTHFSKAVSRGRHEPGPSLPILNCFYQKQPILQFCYSLAKVFVHIKIHTHRNIRDNSLSSFGEIRLPDSTKEPTQQPSKLLRIQCLLCLSSPET